MTEDWWGRRERLEFELRELEDAGFDYEDPDLEAPGPTVLRVRVEIDGEGHQIEVTFPELYPFFRFQAKAPSLDLDHHIAPDGTLCLIGRDPSLWRLDDTLAHFLSFRLPLVIQSGRANSSEAVADIEEHQAEPYSEYFEYLRAGAVLVDGGWEIPPEVGGGTMSLGFTEPGPNEFVLHAAVLELRDGTGGVIGSVDERVARLYSRSVEARWASISGNPPLDPRDFAQLVESNSPKSPTGEWIELPNARQRILAVTFPEESGWREVSGTGWIFFTEAKEWVTNGKLGLPKRAFLRTGRAGAADVRLRAPELNGLEARKIALFGLGCLGAPSALAFARAGCGELVLIDGDHVDPGTVLRWPRGLLASGMRKVHVIASQIRREYPYTTVIPLDHEIGFVGNGLPGIGSDLSIVESALDDADLVFDATANVAVQYFVSEAARKSGIPYLEVSATHGGWGGMVARIRPRETGCWTCLQHHQEEWVESRGERGIPIPPGKKDGTVQPQGCGTPTFMAAGFDMETIAASAVRAAVEMLSDYPMADWDVLVASFRTADGSPTPPTFHPHALEPHPKCRACSVHA